jgi:NADH-quinone oxidoreductase subunit N
LNGSYEFGALLPEIILLIGGILILLLDMALVHERDSGRGFMAVAVLFLALALVAAALQLDSEPRVVYSMVAVDPFSTFFKIVIYGSMILVAIGGGSYMNQRSAWRGEFWMLFLFVTLAMSVAVSANNLLLLFLAFEFLSITSYVLAGFLRNNRRSTEAGVKYFIFGAVASSLMLYGMSLVYGATGSLDLPTIGKAFADSPFVSAIIPLATLMIMVGFGFKATLAPFYQWAPDTYDGAPTPITTYLSTASKAAGFAIMARTLIVAMGFYSVDWVPILAGLSVLTMTLGNLIALRQTDVKRLLAYSSVAQAGYILMGLTTVVSSAQADLDKLSMNGLNGLMLYIFAYLFTNVGAFMVVMAVEEQTGSTSIDSFTDLVRRAPGLAWAMLIFLLSLTGIPLTGGFIGKFYVFGATVQHQYYWLAFAGLVNVGIAAYYYLNVVRVMFFVKPEGEQAPLPRVLTPIAVQVILVICVGATIYLGIYPTTVIEWADNASRQLLAMML